MGVEEIISQFGPSAVEIGFLYYLIRGLGIRVGKLESKVSNGLTASINKVKVDVAYMRGKIGNE